VFEGGGAEVTGTQPQRSVLVTDAGRGSAIAFLRSLGRRGWHVIAADSDPKSAGFRSRFARETFVYPDPERSPRAFVESLHARLRARPVDLVIPVTDECIHPLAHARGRFAQLTRLTIASDEALAIVTDKRATVALARELGVPVPETRVAATQSEALAAARELRFPLVVKPTVSRRYLADEDRIVSAAVSFARDPLELEEHLPSLVGEHPVLLQEFQPGDGVGVECLAHEGRVLRAFQHRRLAEIPVTGGASAWRESVALEPELFAHARKLIEVLAWTGLIMVEFKRGARPWLIEINGRVWGSLPLACLAGVDFPGELAALHFPDTVTGPLAPTDAPYRVGVRAYNFELMLSWIVQVLLGRARHPYLPLPGRARALAGLVGLLDPAQKSDLSDGRDFAPRLAEAGRISRKFASKFTRRMSGATARGG
jgi:predicted ATP-grasp superfamily ATP-dependent carboligase